MDILIISLVTFFAAILTFFSGFGLGTILTPIMILYFPIELAVSFTGIVHFTNNIFKIFIVGKHVNKEVLIRFGLPAILSAFIGSFILFQLNGGTIIYSYDFFGKIFNVQLLKFVISILLLIFALIELVPFFKNLKFEKKTLPLGGFLSGFFGGLTGNQGALRSAFLIKANLNKREFIGTTVLISLLVDVSRIGVYSSNLFNYDLSSYYLLGFCAICSGISGSIIGNLLLKKITLELIQIFVAGLIILIAFGLLIGII
ncbi:MAG: hypothetical protein CMC81_02610 [Flavobacteriaceae bacterium]|nr:hypothetical protein [Flavobacteriaceae bacterium]|tara:strand:- start:1753 stop:2526 length:774 start_codon:yes stop_codon:yes gene_type:complete